VTLVAGKPLIRACSWIAASSSRVDAKGLVLRHERLHHSARPPSSSSAAFDFAAALPARNLSVRRPGKIALDHVTLHMNLHEKVELKVRVQGTRGCTLRARRGLYSNNHACSVHSWNCWLMVQLSSDPRTRRALGPRARAHGVLDGDQATTATARIVRIDEEFGLFRFEPLVEQLRLEVVVTHVGIETLMST